MVIKQILLLAVLALAVIIQVGTTVVPAAANSCSPTQCCDAKTITVFGSATIQVGADQALLYISLAVSGNTSQLAVSGLAADVTKINNILKANGLNSSGLVSNNFNVYPNTSYVNGNSIVLGQIAS
jgi:uncharacterized protein YggE